MLRDKLIEKNIGSKNDFRWRSHEITRIEGFSDAVFAFAVTLLVISLEVPETFDELLHGMSNFIAFGCGFTLLFFVWYNQYVFFRRYGLQDPVTITLNGALLFVVLFFVYPLKFLFTILIKMFSGQSLLVTFPNGAVEPAIRGEQMQQLMTTYGLGYIAVFLVFALLYRHAYKKRAELELTELEQYDTRTSIREALLSVAVGVLSVLIVSIGGSGWSAVSGFTYCLLGPVMAVHGAMSGKRRKKLESYVE